MKSEVRNYHEFPFPCKRIGNEINPKLVILLENPGGNPDKVKWNQEYAMTKDGVYFDSGMKFSDIREYIKWWDDLSVIWNSYNIKDEEVLSLEYYPYPTISDTKKDNIYNKKTWNPYAYSALEENIGILKKLMNIIKPLIFVYYKSSWIKEVPELMQYNPISFSTTREWRSNIIKRLETFLREQINQ